MYASNRYSKMVTLTHYVRFTAYTPTCYVNQTATETTCNYLLARWELTVADFVALNDNVDDACGNLVIGQPVRAYFPLKDSPY